VNLTDTITEIRTTLDDPLIDRNGATLSVKFTDAMLVTALQTKLRSLSRIQVSRDVGYHNFTMVLNSADAVQIMQSVWQWPLPSWVANLVNVWILNLGGPLNPTTQPTFSPYLWPTPPMMNADPFPRARRNYPYGWRFDGNRTFRVWNQATAPNMLLQVAKIPARLFRATLDQDPSSKTTLYLPQALSLGTQDKEEGAYINAEVEVTSGATTENIGLRRRCVYSASVNLDETLTTSIALETAFAQQLEQGDTIETAIPLGEDHSRLLTLLAVQWCFEQTANLPGQKAIADELRQELMDFKAYVSPRDTQGPEFFQSQPIGYGPGYDPDRSYFNIRGVWP
jgi:hypothetical protein